MRAIRAVAINVFRESVRDRVPYALVVFAVLLIGSSYLLGQLTAGAAEPYQYLVESIRKFPRQEKFAGMIREAGFERVSYRNLTGGVAAIHGGWRI